MKNNNILKAVSILQQGGLVAIPTETVYGLAADASNPEALKKIFQAKGRPADHPLIVHIPDLSHLNSWAIDISPQAYQLAQVFWPGPLTLILKKAPHVSALISGGQDTIGIRIPRHPLALELLKTFNGAVAAPSANRFGRISPTTALAVQEELGDAVDMILDGGQCEVGVESTIVDMTSDTPRILRPGMISAADIEVVLHQALSAEKNNIPRVSGSLESHYAPRTPLRVLTKEKIIALLAANKAFVAVLARELIPADYFVKMPETPTAYAHDLYAVLREVDKKNVTEILVETLPDDKAWDAIRDRLQRASRPAL